MSLIEFIGFIASLVMLFVLVVKKSIDEMRRRSNPEEYERQEHEKAERLKAFLHSINTDMEEDYTTEISEKPKQVPEPVTKIKKNQQAPLKKKKELPPSGQLYAPLEESYKPYIPSTAKPFNKFMSISTKYNQVHKSSAETDAYRLEQKTRYPHTRAEETLNHLRSRREMFIIEEIISKPKALR